MRIRDIVYITRFCVAYITFILYVLKHKNYESFEPPHDKTNKVACAPIEDSDQPGHPPSLIRVFAVPMKKTWVFSFPMSAQRRLCSDWADVQADLSLCWAHTHFVMSRLKLRILFYLHFFPSCKGNLICLLIKIISQPF